MNSITTSSGFDIDAVNARIRRNPAGLVSEWENRYDAIISQAADSAAAHKSRIIFLSGPSSSGKTTTSYKLAEALSRLGIHARTVSTDDFFKSRSEAPLLPNGEPDLESIRAVDTDRLIAALNDIIRDGKALLPRYDFQTGVRHDEAVKVDIGKSGILIMEGIHALNPVISAGLAPHSAIKVYISVHSSFERAETVLLPKRWVRFLQRMVRDHRARGISPETNMRLWAAVCEGEDKYIRPYAREADLRIDTTLPYSPSALKSLAMPLLEKIPAESPHRPFADALISALRIFLPIDGKHIPETSVLREFLGGSRYEGGHKKK